MLKPGLVSITFRKLTVDEVLALAVKAKLQGIEWGGDIHVPHGDVEVAELVNKKTQATGIEIVAYGSYYRFQEHDLPFEAVLASAKALNAPLIRVWAGTKGSDETSPAERLYIIHKAREIGERAAEAGIKIAFEYHGHTLTDSVTSTLNLLTTINHPNVFCYWQPLSSHSLHDQVKGLTLVKPWLTHLHVYYWDQQSKKYPLADGQHVWIRYLKLIKDLPEIRYAMLEFVKDNQEDQFLQDAKTLHTWLAKLD